MKKKLIVAGAAALSVAAAVPAFALENEFHGMYKFMGFQTNYFNGVGANLNDEAHSGLFAEQRARLQYIAKANDNLKLVTHFELDARFGGRGSDTASDLYTAKGDGGSLDSDALSLETKNIYLDFNCPITGSNVKVGMQPWADAYQSLFLLADMTGLQVTKGFGPATLNAGWFRYDDNTAKTQADPGQVTADLFVLDGKYALNKDMKVGASYYFAKNDTGAAGGTGGTNFEKLHMLGLNADITAGPATIKPFFAYQFGDLNATDDLSAYALGAVAKVKAGPGAVNLSAFYLSGDKNTSGDRDSFATVAASTTYFNPANMWLLIRNGQMINSSTSVTGTDLTVGGRGFMGFFAGYEGTADKVFYNANIGYAQTAEERGSEDGSLGTEINAQVGYKMFDNMSISLAGAYAFLGDGLKGQYGTLLAKTGTSGAEGATYYGDDDAKDPYMVNLQISYTF